MPNVACPSCGHEFRAVACQCRGHIVSAEAWKLGRWDWRPLFGSFADNVRPMDIDFLVERNGNFLVFETKPPGGAEINSGQRRALEQLSRIPKFTVATLYGEPDEPELIQRCIRGRWGNQHEFTQRDLWHFGADWWALVNRARERRHAERMSRRRAS